MSEYVDIEDDVIDEYTLDGVQLSGNAGRFPDGG